MSLDFYTSILSYFFLYLTVIALWIPRFKKLPLWSILLSISILFGLISQHLEPVTLVFIFCLGGLIWYFEQEKSLICAALIFLLGVGFGNFLLPGFHNLQVLNQVFISTDGIPFSLYLNFDKTILGILIIGFLHKRMYTRHEWIEMLKIMLPRALVRAYA